MNPNRLPWPTKIAYGLPAFALAVVGIPVYVYIPKFYTDVVGVDITLAGILLFGVRLFDAVTDHRYSTHRRRGTCQQRPKPS